MGAPGAGRDPRGGGPSIDPAADPHAATETLAAGGAGTAALVLLHGRGGSARDILALGRALGVDGLDLVAPAAAGGSWYPQSFLAPLDANQPHLDSALRRVDATVAGLLARGVPAERVALLGFSQGACLALEYVARYPRRFGAVMGLTGGLVGPPGMPRSDPGRLDGTPVFLGANDPDPHVPFARVLETRSALERMGADVELRRYPGLPHAVNEDEVEACRALLRALVRPPTPAPGPR